MSSCRPSPYLKTAEAAEYLRVAPSTLRGWVQQGDITPDARAGRNGSYWDDIDDARGVLHVRRAVWKGKVGETKFSLGS